MLNYDFSPFYRSTIGFDRLLALLDKSAGLESNAPAYPPYNIERTGENAYRITLAVAGFAENELTVETRESTLTVRGAKDAQQKNGEEKRDMLYQGIAARAFERRFHLADHVTRDARELRERIAAHRPRARSSRSPEAAHDRDPDRRQRRSTSRPRTNRRREAARRAARRHGMKTRRAPREGRPFSFNPAASPAGRSPPSVSAGGGASGVSAGRRRLRRHDFRRSVGLDGLSGGRARRRFAAAAGVATTGVAGGVTATDAERRGIVALPSAAASLWRSLIRLGDVAPVPPTPGMTVGFGRFGAAGDLVAGRRRAAPGAGRGTSSVSLGGGRSIRPADAAANPTNWLALGSNRPERRRASATGERENARRCARSAASITRRSKSPRPTTTSAR